MAAVRQDMFKHGNMKVKHAEENFAQADVTLNDDRRSFGSIYIPPEGSRHYDDGMITIIFARYDALDFAGGDLNWRATDEYYAEVTRGAAEGLQPRPSFGGRRREATRRKRIMLAAWPHALRTLAPQDPKDFETRTCWSTARGYLLDYLMVNAECESGKAQTLDTPPEIPTDHRPVIARARLPCARAPARRRVGGGAVRQTAQDWTAEVTAHMARAEAQGDPATRLGFRSQALKGRVCSGSQRAARNAAAREAEADFDWDDDDPRASAFGKFYS